MPSIIGRPYESEFRLVNPQTGEIVWVRGQGVLVEADFAGRSSVLSASRKISTSANKRNSEREKLLRANAKRGAKPKKRAV
jgi:hypothetical protein